MDTPMLRTCPCNPEVEDCPEITDIDNLPPEVLAELSDGKGDDEDE